MQHISWLGTIYFGLVFTSQEDVSDVIFFNKDYATEKQQPLISKTVKSDSPSKIHTKIYCSKTGIIEPPGSVKFEEQAPVTEIKVL